MCSSKALMVDVAQLVEPGIVIPVVAGSIPSSTPFPAFFLFNRVIQIKQLLSKQLEPILLPLK